MSTYNQNYYEQNKKRISLYNQNRRKSNPDVVLKERASYEQKGNEYRLRSKIQNLQGKYAFQLLTSKQRETVLQMINKKLDI